jgi:hypothetical protein
MDGMKEGEGGRNLWKRKWSRDLLEVGATKPVHEARNEQRKKRDVATSTFCMSECSLYEFPNNSTEHRL